MTMNILDMVAQHSNSAWSFKCFAFLAKHFAKFVGIPVFLMLKIFQRLVDQEPLYIVLEKV